MGAANKCILTQCQLLSSLTSKYLLSAGYMKMLYEVLVIQGQIGYDPGGMGKKTKEIQQDRTWATQGTLGANKEEIIKQTGGQRRLTPQSCAAGKVAGLLAVKGF